MDHSRQIEPSAVRAQTMALSSSRKERVVRATALQHAGAGLALLVAGLDALQHARGHHTLALIAMALGALLAGAAVRELRALRHQGVHHGKVSWLDLLAAAGLLVEG